MDRGTLNRGLGVALGSINQKKSIEALEEAIGLLKPLAQRFEYVANYRMGLAQAHRNRPAREPCQAKPTLCSGRASSKIERCVRGTDRDQDGKNDQPIVV